MLFIKNSDSKHKKISTAIFVGTGVVLFWRGIWGLADLLFFPDNPLLSYGLSFVLGIAILYITHYLIQELL